MENTIKKLLYSYDCVIIPDFGGFVAKRKSAVFHPMEYKFDPPKKVIGFNSDLTHTDGLLANELSKNQSISYPEAIELIDHQVSEWKSLLNQNKTIEIAGLGSFKQKNNHLEFYPDANQNFALETFGLESIKGNYILRDKKETVEQKPTGSWVSYAAAIGFALLVGGSSFFANNNLVQPQLSSFLPLLGNKTIVAEEAIETPVAPIIDVNALENIAEINSEIADSEVTSIKVSPSETTELVNEEVETEKAEIDLSVKQFQVIGGSFKVYSQAMEHRAKLIRDGHERAVIVGKVGNFYMVAFDTFHNETEAANYKRELEKQGHDVFTRP